MQRHFLRFVGWVMALAVVSTGFVLSGARQAKAEDLSTYLSKPQYERRQESLQRMQDFLQGIEPGSTATSLRAAPTPQASAPMVAPLAAAPAPLAPGTLPAYGFNPLVDYSLPNFAYSPNLRKFVDALPGLGSANANLLGQYIPVAVPDNTTFPGNDYYEIGVATYQQQMHSDLPGTGPGTGTHLRGYYQKNGVDHAKQYLGPLIIARRDRPVRIKYFNELATGTAGNLPLPVDPSVMGAGEGPNGTAELYTQNRVTIHLHGGYTPWISDGTPHQWFTPAGDPTSYKKGDSFQNVPDMITGSSVNGTPVPCIGGATCYAPSLGDGIGTLYYTNQQSSRLMFYHDHAYGITRLNVYAGMAAGYLIVDPVEDDLISGTNATGVFTAAGIPATPVLPDQSDLGAAYKYGIPLIIQDKTFVNDVATPPGAGFPGSATPTAKTIDVDPRWDNVLLPVVTSGGDLWLPHEYMPNQNIFDPSGFNVMGRWDYGPFLVPPMPALHSILPSPTIVPEAFMDTMLVNGTAFPYVTLQPKAYRFRVLNAANDRMLNLQLYYAQSKSDNTANGYCDNTSSTAPAQADCTEVKMVPAHPNASFPTWPADGRDGGVPDPLTVGPDWIQIGSEGGFLVTPAVTPAHPVAFDYNRTSVTFGNVATGSLYMIPADRDDVIVDFSSVAPGSTLIVYNDAPAPMPLFDARYDIYTGKPDETAGGGTPSIPPGFGPNTRTIMQIRIAGTPAPAPFALGTLTTVLPKAFAASQDHPLVMQSAYDGAYGTTTTDIYPNALTESLNVSGSAQPVAKVVIEVPGLGYTSAPTATLVGGGGTGATATASLNGVTGLILLNEGNGYTSAPSVLIDPPPSGMRAEAKATMTGGIVTVVTITNPGSGYTTAPNVTFMGGSPTTPASAQALITLGSVGAITLDTPGSGYTTAPLVVLSGGGGTGAMAVAMLEGSLVFNGKNLVEGMDMEYGRMFAQLGSTPNLLDPTVGAGPVVGLARYLDPPTEIMNDGQTVLWRFTHLGADSHAIHFHLFNVQVLGRVDWTNTVIPPYPDELGWKEVIQTNPFEDIFVAIRPVAIPSLPFPMPDSKRLLDTTTPEGSTKNFLPVAPPPGVPQVAQIRNVMTNFGGEYVWHCHLLGHEENDMMRPIIFIPATSLPAAPSGLGATLAAGPRIDLAWTVNSSNDSGFRIERNTNGGAFAAVGFAVGGSSSYSDTTVASNTTYSYRIFAVNDLGDSPVSNTTAGVPTGASAPAAPTALTATRTGSPQVTLAWQDNSTDETGFRIERNTNGAGFVAIGTTIDNAISYVDNTAGPANSYAYRVFAFNGVGDSLPSNVASPGAAAVTLAPSPGSPQAPGASVLWTAVASGGSGSYQYQFWLWNGSSWSLAKPYGATNDNTWTWDTTSLATGTYYVQAWVRNAGSAASWEAYTSVEPYVLSTITPATSVTLTPPPSPASPQAPGTSVLWTAVANGGSGSYQYQFWLNNGTSWSIAKPYGATNDNTWTWDTGNPLLPAGTYSVQVWARSAGSAASWEAFTPVTTYVLAAAVPPATSVTLTPPPSPASPQAPGTSVLWTAVASGGSGSYQYQFWLNNGTSWSIAKPYGATNDNTWTWDTGNPLLPAGTYSVQVWARSAGSAAAYEAFTPATTYDLSAISPATGVTFSPPPSPDPASPQPPGTVVTWKAAATGGSGNYQYQFWLNNGTSWSIAKPYGATNDNTWTWDTGNPLLPAGTYSVQVWARNVGSSATWEAYTPVESYILGP